jgi:uncharacterized protein YjbI with pentapeptide repeats
MRFREWLGVGERRWKKTPDEEVQPAKTLWDWLQLLIVPAILIGVTFAWSGIQTRNDKKREDRRSQDATLQAYFDEMSGLMLKDKLLASKPKDPVRAVARTVTLTALRRLDGERKGEIVRFLFEARLLSSKDEYPDWTTRNPSNAVSKVSLEGADLSGANLAHTDLHGAILRNTDLTGANLFNASVVTADLENAILTGANLEHLGASESYLANADLRHAHLAVAGLNGANLLDADIRGADLRHAELHDADLGRVDLRGADLEGVDLRGAKHLDQVDLRGAKHLDQAVR